MSVPNHDAKCQKLALGKPEDLIKELNWQDKTLTWIGPYPKSWKNDPPAYDLAFVELMSPGLDAFDLLIGQSDFADRNRTQAAGPINELIR